jgi:hypothetical protein
VILRATSSCHCFGIRRQRSALGRPFAHRSSTAVPLLTELLGTLIGRREGGGPGARTDESD